MKILKDKPKLGKTPIRCEVCGKPATHSIVLNIRDNYGPPIKKDNVVQTVCEEHSKGTFNDLIPSWYWAGLVNEYRRKGLFIMKEYSDVEVIAINFNVKKDV